MVTQSSTLAFYRLENGLQTLLTFSILYKYVGSDNLTPVSGTSTAQRRNHERLTEKPEWKGHPIFSCPFPTNYSTPSYNTFKKKI